MNMVSETYSYYPVRIRSFKIKGNEGGNVTGSRLLLSPEGMPDSSQGFIPAGSVVMYSVLRVNTPVGKAGATVSVGSGADGQLYHAVVNISAPAHYVTPNENIPHLVQASASNLDSTILLTMHTGMTGEEYAPLDMDLTFYIINTVPSTE